MAGAQKHKEKVVRQSSNGVSYLMKKNRVDVTQGFGRIDLKTNGIKAFQAKFDNKRQADITEADDADARQSV